MKQPHIPFLDLHAHFPMHTGFPPLGRFENPLDIWRKPMFDLLNPPLNYGGLEPRVSLSHWFDDDRTLGVTGFGSVLYNPQEDFFVKKRPIAAAYKHILAQLQNVEKEIRKDGRVQIALKPSEVDDYLTRNEPFIFHTLEGGFSLGGDASHVEPLADKGVASIIPAHLFFRGVATCENGFPPLAYRIFKKELDDQPKLGLTTLGEEIVHHCFDRGVIVDITHAREDAQNKMFEIAEEYPHRPVISSHNSVRAVNPAGLNLSKEAIEKIQRTGGIIGVIFYTHWLRPPNAKPAEEEIPLVINVIEAIHDVTHNYEHVGIGSDLDGFIEPIKECPNYSQMSNLSRALLFKYGQTIAEKILFRNALRVLYAGWDGAKVRRPSGKKKRKP